MLIRCKFINNEYKSKQTILNLMAFHKHIGKVDLELWKEWFGNIVYDTTGLEGENG